MSGYSAMNGVKYMRKNFGAKAILYTIFWDDLVRNQKTELPVSSSVFAYISFYSSLYSCGRSL